MLLSLLLALSLAGCRRDDMLASHPGPAAQWLARMQQGATYPTRIRFHPQPQPGQWADYREGRTLVSWRVLEAQPDAQQWTVEQLILFVEDGEWIRVRLQVDAEGRVLAAQAQLDRGEGDGSEVLELRLAPPLAPPPLAEELQWLPVAEPVAGLPVRILVAGKRRYAYSPAAYFGHLLSDAELAGLGGLVLCDSPTGVARELVAQGDAPRATPLSPLMPLMPLMPLSPLMPADDS